MLSSRRLMLAILIGALAIAVILLPNEDEKATMLLRDKKHAEAYQELNKLYEAGNRQPHILMQLVEQNELYGFVDNIEPILKAYQKAHPGDIAVNIKLKDFYYETIQFPAYLDQLEILTDIDPKPEYVERLFAHYRLNGDIDGEHRLLKKYLNTPAFTATQAARLGMIYLNMNKPDEAIHALKHMDRLDHNSDDHWGGRLAMFRLLAEDNRLVEAFKHAKNWVVSDEKGRHLSILIKQLKFRGRTDLAIALSEDAIQSNPDMVFQLVNLLIIEKQFNKAQAHLARWNSISDSPSGKNITSYIKTSIAARNLPAAVKLLLSKGISGVPEEALLSIGEELIYQNQIALLNSIRPYLSLEGLEHHPLFAAQLFSREGKQDLAMYFLQQVGPTKLPAYQSVVWFSLYKKLHGKYQAIDYVGQLMAQNKLPKPLIREYASTAYKLGLLDEYELAWVALGGHQ